MFSSTTLCAMTDLATRTCTVEAYLERDAAADDVRYEYDNGTLIPMAGAEPEHVRMTFNVALQVGNRLADRNCFMGSADMRVRVESGFVYPDFVVACDPRYENTRPKTLLNPELLVEVLSESTRHRDQQDKLIAYLNLRSLQEYWIIDPGAPWVAQYIRAEDGWQYRQYTTLDETLRSAAFDLAIPMQAVYQGILYDPEA